MRKRKGVNAQRQQPRKAESEITLNSDFTPEESPSFPIKIKKPIKKLASNDKVSSQSSSEELSLDDEIISQDLKNDEDSSELSLEENFDSLSEDDSEEISSDEENQPNLSEESDEDCESISGSEDADANVFEFDEVEDALHETKNDIENNLPHPNLQNDEYAHDSSDEEDIRNTVGNIPLNWYDEYPHIGYDLDGKKLIRPKQSDKLDDFLRRMEDPDFWRTVKDKQTGQNVILSDMDVELIDRIQSGKIPDPNFNDFAPWIDWFSSEVLETPLRGMPPSKASFLPSKIEKMKISKMVHALKMGWMKPSSSSEKKQKEEDKKFYMLWESDDKAEAMRRIHNHIPAPKTRLPGNAESYNPPAEYLFDENEKRDWDNKSEEPWKRKYNFIPQKYTSLRQVPAYQNYIKERFERCLDLYLCPRAKKMRLTIKAEDLVPQLPSPKDLQPFPTVLSLEFKGHTNMVRSISMEPHGQFFASGSDDGSVKIWEVRTGRCMRSFVLGETVRWVEWCPNKSLSLLAVAVDNDVVVLNPGVGDKLIVDKTDTLLADGPPASNFTQSERVSGAATWESPDSQNWELGLRIIIRHFKQVRQVTWHGKGDYFSAVMPEGLNRSVIIHQLSTRRSQLPLNRSKGLIQCVLFHPIKPFYFIATQRHVRIYDLVKQAMVKKLVSGAKWISSIAIHPGGDNIIVGTYDKKVIWFDLDLSTKPYQTLRFHGNAIRSVAYHKRYPLFASGSDDCSLIVSHGMVYHDLLQNPLIVPVKKLRGHEKFNDFGILSVMWHNMQPWVFSSGADHTIKLYT